MGSKMGAAQKRRHMTFLYQAQGGRCAHCGRKMPNPDAFKGVGDVHRLDQPSLDHIKTRRKGGTNDRLNLLLAHSSCNYRRGCGPLPPRALEVARRIAPLILAHRALHSPEKQQEAA